ncbi:MAG: hypothetical protein OSJ70_00140 [Bacilli bacterium]|nr:hypothetical protein [Bacilli bacterium]
MQPLEVKTQKEVLKIFDDYRLSDRLADKKFITNILDILNQDTSIDNRIPYEIKNNIFGKNSYYKNGINIFNVGAIRNFISDFPEMYREYYDEADDAKIANTFAIYEIFYRCMQMMQRLGITGNCELDKMYYDLYAYIDSLPPSVLKKYIRKNKWTVMDRNARIAAFKEISELLTLSNIHMISTLQYLYYLGVGYRDCVISPMAHEYERLGREYKYDFSALSFIDGLENGVLEDEEKIDKALLMIDEAFNDKKSPGSVYYALRRE